MNLIFFDDTTREQLLPLTYTRPVADLRIGILKISEKWKIRLNAEISYLTQDYLKIKFPVIFSEDNYIVSGGLIPDRALIDKILSLNKNEALFKNKKFLASRLNKAEAENFSLTSIENLKSTDYPGEIRIIDQVWELFTFNGEQIEADYKLLTENRKTQQISKTNNVLGDNLFVEEGVKAEFVTINTTTGPVYLGKNSEIMEGTVIRGPFALCEESTVKLSAKIYGPTTIGPHSKVGGEINNSIFQSYSNKGHDGFLGNSVIGEWCNLGADTNNSNLKNNYADVKIWSYPLNRFSNTGLQFCGLIMGDHSKCGINTMFNTGTVVGVNANIFGSGFPRNFIPSFSWGGAHGFSEFSINKAFEVAEKVMSRRGIEFDDTEKNILSTLFELTKKYRK
ncbi:MAG: GlmU family protein [Bacteroidales bacterium]|nr:GlmU family protein [Bacteroidales bacterium]